MLYSEVKVFFPRIKTDQVKVLFPRTKTDCVRKHQTVIDCLTGENVLHLLMVVVVVVVVGWGHDVRMSA
jgi:hypothetical protein